MKGPIENQSGSQYQYEYTGPQGTGQAETGGELPPVMPEGGPLPTRDALMPSLQQEAKEKPPGVDKPGLPPPIPTPKDVRNEDLRTRILKGLIGSNPAYTGKNYLGILMIKYGDYLDNVSKTRLNESKLEQTIQEFKFKLGIENANFAKTLKDFAAQKEFIAAIGHYVNAAVSFIQIGASVHQRGAAKREAAKSVEAEKQGPQKKLDDLTAERDALQGQTGDFAAGSPEEQQQLTRIADKDKEIALAQKDLNLIKHKEDKAYKWELQQREKTVDNLFQAFKGLTDGATRFASGLVTLEEGKLEKAKGVNEALLQVLSKLDDDLRKSRDELLGQLDKFFQGLGQLVSDSVRAHLVGRG